jgi:hypothetical protein
LYFNFFFYFWVESLINFSIRQASLLSGNDRPALRSSLPRLRQLRCAALGYRPGGRWDYGVDVAVGGLVQVDYDRGVVAWGFAFAGLAVDPGGLDAVGYGAAARIRSMRIPRSRWNMPAR